MAKRALISAYDKTGVAEFAQKLAALGFEIISTGSTAKTIKDAGVAALEVQDLTGFPECLDGRVKTLHPKIHGGLLAIRNNPAHMAEMKANGVEMIDLVVVNLYPFRDTVSQPGVTLAEAIEKIDIGGPAMLRSAAKNYPDVTVIVDPADYARVLAAIEKDGAAPADLNFELAQKVFEHTSGYDALIAEYLRQQVAAARAPEPNTGADTEPCADTDPSPYFPRTLTFTYELQQTMRYGENPHQTAAFYREPIPQAGSLPTLRQLHGKELSYNNIGDLDGALGLLCEFDAPAVVAVKHANPCGAATADDIHTAYMKAYECDPMSIFGGVITANRPIDEATAAHINTLFMEIVAAPGYDAAALKILKKKKNIRLLEIDTAAARAVRVAAGAAGVAGAGVGVGVGAAGVSGSGAYAAGVRPIIKKVGGGLLVQSENLITADMDKLTVVTRKQPTAAQIEDLLFAMTVVKHTKSNAIVFAKDGATIGVGPGQNARILATEIAAKLAGGRAAGAVAASDAYFPMPDCVELMAASGIAAIIQPGGSIKDSESIEACDRLGLAMVYTGIRHFKH